MDYFSKSLEIKCLLKSGFDFLIVELSNGQNIFILSTSFEPPNITSIGSSPYLIVNGIDVTSFFDSVVYNQGNEEFFKERFDKFVKDNLQINFKFSSDFKWLYLTI